MSIEDLLFSLKRMTGAGQLSDDPDVDVETLVVNASSASASRGDPEADSSPKAELG